MGEMENGCTVSLNTELDSKSLIGRCSVVEVISYPEYYQQWYVKAADNTLWYEKYIMQKSWNNV